MTDKIFIDSNVWCYLFIKENVRYMYKLCTVQNFSNKIITAAFDLRERYSLSFWDSIIVSSALDSNCSILASEDMHNGLKINGMVITNIFQRS